MKLTLTSRHFQLKLKHPFTISRFSRTHQDTVVVAISNGEITGYGEAIPYTYYNITKEKIEQSLESSRALVAQSFGLHPDELWVKLEVNLKGDYFTLCALNCAYWDFYAKSHNRTTRSYFANDIERLPLTDFTIGIDTVELMKQKILEMPWPIYKIKLGTTQDVEIVSELRKVTNAVFRIDANGAWAVQETLENAKKLKTLGVEFIEQPLKVEDWEGMKVLKAECVLPVIADESCQRLEDIERCAEVFQGVNIKLMKCGGITPALKMIKLAREKKLKVMLGCMAESSVGIASLCQVAPLVDYLDADGALLLDTDTADGVKIENGKIMFKDYYGSGVLNLKSLNSYKGL